MNRSDNDPVSAPEPSPRVRADRRVRTVAFGISAALHLVVILLYAADAGSWLLRAGRVSIDAGAESSADGTRIVNLVEVEEPEPEVESPVEEPEPEEEEEEEEEGEESTVTEDVTSPSEGEVAGFDEDRSLDPIAAADVFRFRVNDPTFWTIARPDLLLLTPEQRQELEIQGRLEAWNDSVNAAIEAEAAAVDWTTTDGSGGRWGVSPGKLHLGKITLPLPFGFGPNPWQARQIAEQRARDEEIAFHAQNQAVRASWKERAEAIRRRKDRERAREREKAQPDSSRSGGGEGRGF